MSAIPLRWVTKKTDRVKPPPWYGKVLMQHREALGLSRQAFEERTGINAVKVLRNETGMDDRSVKGSSEIRDALIKLGRDVPPVPVGDAPEPASTSAEQPGRVDTDDPKNKTIRQNVRRLRERAGYDVEGLADALRIPTEQLLDYERGEKLIPPSMLEEIARRLGHEISDFWSDTPPESKLGAFEDFWRRRRLHDRLTPEQQATKRQLDDEYARKLEAALSPSFAAEKRAVDEHIKKAKQKKGKP